MQPCDISLKVSRADRVYRPGETIRGTLTATVRENFQCKNLLVTLCWRTAGKGNSVEGAPVKVSLGSHDWQAAEVHELPFELEAPAGPLSYKGQLLSVVWELRAHGNTRGWADPKAAPLILTLERWTAQTLVQEGGSYRAPPKHFAGDYGLGPTARLPVLAANPSSLMGCGATVAVAGLLTLAATWGSTGMVVAIVFALLGALVFFAALPQYLAQRRLGAPSLVCEPHEVVAGGEVCTRLSVTPQAEALVNDVSVQLRGRERVVHGHGKGRTTLVHVLHEQHGKLSLGPHAPGGRDLLCRAQAQDPAGRSAELRCEG